MEPRTSPWKPGPRWWPAGLLALPLLWLATAGGRAFGHFSVDLAGHLWTSWVAGRAGVLHTTMIGWPEGVDLLPALGGWLDVMLVAALRAVLPLELAYDIVAVGYLVVLGAGGWLLARNAGASRPVALVVGLLLQLDGFVLQHLAGGRLELVALGFVAVFLALVQRAWRGGHPHASWQAGLAGALLLLASWELGLLAGVSLALLLPFRFWAGRPPGLGRRLRDGIVVGALLALPWVGLFLVRASGVRGFDEGEFWLRTASHASVGLLGWFGPGSARPCWLALAALVVLPWTLPRGQRRLWVGVGVGLLLSMALALGPHPGLLQPGSPAADPWGPFALLRSLPVLGWFHWPDRLLAVWSLAAAVAAGLAVQWLAGRWRWAGVALALVLLADAGLETWRSGRWPVGHYRVPEHAGADALAELPGGGAVLDLPPQPNPVNHLNYELLQLRHGRPIRYHHHLGHLVADGDGGSVDAQPLPAWFHGLMRGADSRREPFDEVELRGLVDAGFGYVVLHQKGWPAERWSRARDLMLESLGDPVIQQGSAWMCWRLSGAGDGERTP